MAKGNQISSTDIAAFRLEPAPKLHEVVYYFQNGSRFEDPICAVVIGPMKPNPDGRVDLVVLRRYARDIKTFESVLHVDDPRGEKFPGRVRDNGAWDFTPEGKAMREREADVASLKKDVSELKTQMAEMQKYLDDIWNDTLPGTSTGKKAKGN